MRRSLPFAILFAVSLCVGAIGPARAASVERFVVYFGSWSALIEPQAQRVIRAAVAAAKKNVDAPIQVTGYASTIGSTAANTLLSQLRAQMIDDELVAEGIDGKRISVTSTGATSFVVEPVESRRVVIEVRKP